MLTAKAHPATRPLFRFGHAVAADWRAAVDDCVAQMKELPDGANLGFLYISDLFAEDAGPLLAYLKRRTGLDQWVGTVGVGICAGGREYLSEPAVALMAGSLPLDSFRVFDLEDRDLDSMLEQHGKWLSTREVPFGIVHADPRNHRLPGLLAGLAERMGNGFLVGGLASSRNRYLQIAGEVSDSLFSGVLFSDAVAVSTRLTQGCVPLGQRHVITSSQRNVIITLDNQPALEVFKQEIGEMLAKDLKRIGGYIFAALPIPGSDTGDYLVRHIVGIDPQHGVLAIGDMVETGDSILFCKRDPQSAYEDLLRMLREIKPHDEIRGAVYFSCLGRGEVQFGPGSKELRAIQGALGDIPLVGFFSNGEISHNRLYGYTGVLTLFL